VFNLKIFSLEDSYFKLKDIPSAILYYEKALKINPSDDDTKHNLQIANSMIVDKIEPLPQFFFRAWWNTFYTLLSANAWAYISVFILLLTLLAAYFYFTSFNSTIRKIAFFVGILLVLLTITSFGLASQKYYYTRQINEAIVFIPTITIKSSPALSSVDLFVLHEGTKLRILDQTNGWAKIKIANGSIGWIPQEVIKGI
jgi:tetratricopeptide (TPR) repeat protein